MRPVAHDDRPRKKSDATKKMRTWTKEHLKVLLDAMKHERLSSPLRRTNAMTGMRRAMSAVAKARSTQIAWPSLPLDGAAEPHPDDERIAPGRG